MASPTKLFFSVWPTLPDKKNIKALSPHPLDDASIPHRWKPGESGNPKGRPPENFAVKKIARENSKAAIRVLIRIMKDESQKAVSRIAAANAVLDRGYGKVAQEVRVQGTGKDGEIEVRHMTQALSTDELRVMRDMLGKVGAVVADVESVPLLEDADDTNEEGENADE